jgi:hypothetical protein
MPRKPKPRLFPYSERRSDRIGILVRLLHPIGYQLVSWSGSDKARFQVVGGDGKYLTERMRIQDVEDWLENVQVQRCKADIFVSTSWGAIGTNAVRKSQASAKGTLHGRVSGRLDKITGRIARRSTITKM